MRKPRDPGRRHPAVCVEAGAADAARLRLGAEDMEPERAVREDVLDQTGGPQPARGDPDALAERALGAGMRRLARLEIAAR